MKPTRFALRYPSAQRRLALCLSILSLTACAPAPSPLPMQLRQALPLGISLADARKLLDAKGATVSIRDIKECMAMIESGNVRGQISPHGGPCLFGKIPVDHAWYGTRRDVIVQLVFDPTERLADANFEEIAFPF